MIEAYWWQGMRQNEVGPGGTLYLAGDRLGEAGDVVRWGSYVLPVRWRHSSSLWAVTGITLPVEWRAGTRPELESRVAFPVFIQHYQGTLTEGPELGFHPEWPKVATGANIHVVGDGQVRPGDVVAVYWKGPPTPNDLEAVTWGAHRLPIRGTRLPQGVAIAIPADLPEGEAAVSLVAGGVRLWGPPVRVAR